MIYRRAFSFALIVALTAVAALRSGEDASARDRAAEILAATGVRGGFIVHLGCGDGELTAALRANDGYLVHGLDRDAGDVRAARRRLAGRDDHGEVSVDRLRGSTLPYVDGLVNLVVAEEPGDVSMDEILRVLAPGGVAYTRRGDSWKKTVKPRPGNIDDWTHYLHDATGNAVASDTVVGPPRHLQWLGTPRWSRHHDRMASMSALVSDRGRLYLIMDEGSRVSIQLPPKWRLIARDAFNGVILWKREIPTWHSHLWPLKSGPTQLARRLVAVDGTVYMTLGLEAPLVALDGDTGETIRTYDESKSTEEILLAGDSLFLLVNRGESELSRYVPKLNVGDQQRVANEFLWNEKERFIVSFEAATGRRRWERKERVVPLTLCSDGESVYFHDGDKVVCLDAGTGDERWSSEPASRRRNVTMNFGPRLVVYGDVVLFAGGDGVMRSLSAESGKELWSATRGRSGYQSPEDLLVVGGLVWSAPTTSTRDTGVFTGRDVRTGEVKAEFPPDVETYWFHHRCHIAKATDRFILPSRTGIEFVDFREKRWEIHHWVRGGCLYGVLPANGLLYAPPHNCACYPEAKLFGFNALAPASASRASDAVAVTEAERLERGPAFAANVQGEGREGDWPTYRRDAARSGRTTTAVPAELESRWAARLGGRLSSIVVADGRLYVARVDAHTLHALDADSGNAVWSHVAGGRIDSPPTVWEGRVLFGSADGRVTCLRASDGELIWRFLAAPRDLRLMAFEQLESVWPVHGSVLVDDGKAFFVAGRSNFLDGGLRFYKLDARTGKVLGTSNVDERDPESGENIQARLQILNMTAGLADILSTDGQFIYMRSQRFDSSGRRLELGPHSGQPSEQGSVQAGEGKHIFAPMGFLDDTWFHRAYWVYGRSYAGGHSGYYQAGKFAPSGRILVFDDDNVYGFARKPQYYRWTTTLEHHLFSTSKEPPSAREIRRGGPSMVRVGKSESLDPTGKPIVVEAWVKLDRGGGVVLARGGPAQGYALHFQGRKPRFSVRADSKLASAVAAEAIGEDWAHLVGVLTPEKEVRIYVDGKLAGSARAPSLITSDPAQALEIGADDAGSVGDYRAPALFAGTIDEVRVYHGTLTDDEIRQRSSDLGRAPARGAKLVLSCSFDSGDGADSSGNGNHGRATGVTVTKGKLGNALKFRGRANRAGGSFVRHHWTKDVPILVRAIVLAGDTLFIAGPPDVIDEESTFKKLIEADTTVSPRLVEQDAALRGEKGSLLLAIDATGGETRGRVELPSVPVWDGLAAANGRLYLATGDGRVVCLAGKGDGATGER